MFWALFPIIRWLIVGFFMCSRLYHPLGFIENQSDSGRTHYLVLRPSLCWKYDWWIADMRVPIETSQVPDSLHIEEKTEWDKEWDKVMGRLECLTN